MLRNLQIDLDKRLRQIHHVFSEAFKDALESDSQHPAQLLFYALTYEVNLILNAIQDGSISNEAELKQYFDLLNDHDYRQVYIINFLLRNETTLLQNPILGKHLKPFSKHGAISCEKLADLFIEPTLFGSGLFKARKWHMIHELTRVYYLLAKQHLALKQAELQMQAQVSHDEATFRKKLEQFQLLYKLICTLNKALQEKIADQSLRFIDQRTESLIKYKSDLDVFDKQINYVNSLKYLPEFTLLAELLVQRSRLVEAHQQPKLKKIYVKIFTEINKLKAKAKACELQYATEKKNLLEEIVKQKTKFAFNRVTLHCEEFDLKASDALFPELKEIRLHLVALHDQLVEITQDFAQLNKWRMNQQLIGKLAEVMNGNSDEMLEVITATAQQCMRQSYNNPLWQKHAVDILRASLGCERTLQQAMREYLNLCEARLRNEKKELDNLIIYSNQYHRISEAYNCFEEMIFLQVAERLNPQHVFYQEIVKKICYQELQRIDQMIAILSASPQNQDLTKLTQIERDMRQEAGEVLPAAGIHALFAGDGTGSETSAYGSHANYMSLVR